MSRRTLRLLLPLFLLAFLAVAGSAQAAGEQYFIKITGIPGDSTNQGAENEIRVESFAWNVTQKPSAAGRGGAAAGKPTFSDFTFTHQVDVASPLLLRAAALGNHLQSARFQIINAGSEERTTPVEYCLEDVQVTGVNVSGKAEDGMPRETVSLAMGRFEERFNPQSSTGQPLPPVLFGWDLVRNREIGFNNSCGSVPSP